MALNEADRHALNLGKLVGNIQSLEFALRAFLVNDEIASGALFAQSANLQDMNVDDIVSENAFTNYNNLRQLIRKYNRHPKIISASLDIDETLVDVRDAISHGRVSAASPSSSLRLLKFGKPENHQAKVTFSILMTKEWFGEQISRFHNAILRVSEANDKLQTGRL